MEQNNIQYLMNKYKNAADEWHDELQCPCMDTERRYEKFVEDLEDELMDLAGLTGDEAWALIDKIMHG